MKDKRLRLRRYQAEGVAFLRSHRRSILADEMGLGKTVQAVIATETPALVICPASVKIQWRREFEKWRPDLRYGTGDQGFQVVSYADPHLPLFEPGAFRTVIVDEAHYVKNPEAARTRHVCALVRAVGRHGRAFALSGTIPPNRPIELWALLYAMRITNRKYLDFAFCYAGAFEGEYGLDVRGSSHEAELRALLEPFFLRRLKKDVIPELPPKEWRVIALDLPPLEAEKEFDVYALEKMAEPVAFEAMSDVLHLHGQRKVPAALEHIQDVLEGGVEKLIVFAHHRDVLDVLVEALAEHHPVSVKGGDSPMKRQRAVDVFQGEPSCRVFVGQIGAAGVGLNLGVASHVVFVEASWVPAVLDQAADRAHRMDSEGSVTVDLLTIHRSIDEHMLRRALEKAAVVSKILPRSKGFVMDAEACEILYG